MSDIFLSYANEDRDWARVLAEALGETGWSVFWDRTIPPGLTWRNYIGRALKEASCLVVAWSVASVESDWVLEEAEVGKKKGILIPVFREEVEPPLGFGALQGTDLAGWDGDTNAPSFQELVKGMERLLGTLPRPLEEEKGPQAEEAAERQAQDEAEERKAPVKRKTTPKRSPPAASRPILATEKGAPTWEEDEQLNRRIRIEGGEFLMGSPRGSRHERPQHRVRLSTFYIQEHPVTNEEYHRFAPDHEFKKGKERHPVVEVDWQGAMAYAEWLGGSLPTEAQWEFTARGSEGRTYPWGNEEPTRKHAQYMHPFGDTVPVKSLEGGKTPEGVYDLAGTVWEWCRDWFGPYSEKDQVDPTGPETGEFRVLLGGSFRSFARSLRDANRLIYSSPGRRFDDGGFRVVWSAARELD